ncbi:hypothetical protein EJD97_007611 [Solanum chilense]|uniref:Cystatin domain-containing protein n=1 Tax=Solanum chilense TaxID=4083 RepID=A0A6N2BW94_SOLCI|nr:hypothetical protein EJD97_007611 [Solanum chilense]
MALKINSFPLTMFLILVFFSTFLHISLAKNNLRNINLSQYVDPKDPKAIEIGKFALNEYNKKKKSNCQFKQLYEVTTFPSDDGVLYELLIIGDEWDTIVKHLADVLVRSNNVMEVTRFDGSPFSEI